MNTIALVIIIIVVISVATVSSVLVILALNPGASSFNQGQYPQGYYPGGYNVPGADDSAGFPEPYEPATPTEPTDDNSNVNANYKTADKLTTITFSRELTSSGVTQSANFKLTGYLREIDPETNPLNIYSDRAFVFEQANFEWNLEETETDVGNRCTRVVELWSSGNTQPSELNVYYELINGQGTSINGAELPDYGNIVIMYYNSGINELQGPQLSSRGELLLPVDITESTVCEDSTDTTIRKKSVTLDYYFEFYDSFSGIPKQGTFSSYGTFAPVRPDAVSGYQNAALGFPVLVTSLSVPVDDAPWEVEWELEFPE